MMSWDEIINQNEIVALLKTVAQRDVCDGAYLISGRSGIGKRYLARTFAQAVLCLNKDSGAPCGTCKSCRQFEHENHPDFHLLELGGDQTQIRVDMIRDLEKNIYRKTVQSPNRVVMIPLVERMNESAANAFLKTLEEPPPGTVIVMTSARISDLIPTILSRCIRLTMKPVPARLLADALVSRFGMDEADATRRAAFSHGAIGRALADQPRDRIFNEFIAGEFPGALQNPYPGALAAGIEAAVDRACEAEGVKSAGHGQRNMIAEFLPSIGVCLSQALKITTGVTGDSRIPPEWNAVAELLSRGGEQKIEMASDSLTKASHALSVFVRPSLCLRHIARRLIACAR